MKVICYSCKGDYHCQGTHFTNEGSCKCDCGENIICLNCDNVWKPEVMK